MNNPFPLPAKIESFDDLRTFCVWLRASRCGRFNVVKAETDKLMKLAPDALRILKHLQVDVQMTSAGCVARQDMTRMHEFFDAMDRTTFSIGELADEIPL